MVLFAFEAAGAAHHLRPSKLTLLCVWWMVNVEFDIPGDKQIQLSVSVVITECCSGGPGPNGYARTLSQVCERAISIVVIEPVFSVIRYVKIWPAVIVVIPDRATLSPAVVGNSGRS